MKNWLTSSEQKFHEFMTRPGPLVRNSDTFTTFEQDRIKARSHHTETVTKRWFGTEYKQSRSPRVDLVQMFGSLAVGAAIAFILIITFN